MKDRIYYDLGLRNMHDTSEPVRVVQNLGGQIVGGGVEKLSARI
jgi:hypothetical protein